MRILGFVLCLALPAAAGGAKLKEIGPKAKGKVFAWKSDDGLEYTYRVPRKYDPDQGANLTFILHGSNLTRYWGFANHPYKTFRPDDIVVSPDGTTPNGRGGFNFMGQPKDAQRLKALHDELKKVFKINATYLYGHSQGSFFALYYAGEYPDAVQGVVAHASGAWNWTKRGDFGHGQAIVLMHGTQDPVVSYAQSVGTLPVYVEAKYPMVRLRSLEGWNHWPAENNGPVPHTSHQLAWCEGMTTTDAARLEICFDLLADPKVKDDHDYAALYTLAGRVAGFEGASPALKKRAEAARAKVEKLASNHVAALADATPDEFEADPWVAHLPLFLRSFMDVPAREEYAAGLAEALARHRDEGIANLRQYYQTKKDNPARAFAAGVKAIEVGFLHYECTDRRFLADMATFRKQAKKLRIDKQAVKAYDAIVPAFTKMQREGRRDFDGVNRKY